MTERRGDWFQTFTGRTFYVLDPRAEDVDLGDIAHALSRICRFGGHCRDFYSVAQHSVIVSKLVRPHLALAGLLHDAEEAYTGDVIRPLKYGLRASTTAFDDIAEAITRAIAQRFGLPEAVLDDAEIKHADNIALSTERRDLLVPTGRKWKTDELFPPDAERIVALDRNQAELAFLARFKVLTGGLKA